MTLRGVIMNFKSLRDFRKEIPTETGDLYEWFCGFTKVFIPVSWDGRTFRLKTGLKAPVRYWRIRKI